MNFVTRKEVLEKLGIHFNTLQNMVKRGDIEYVTVGTYRKYNLDKYIRDNNKTINRRRICYCRVSSKKQASDLENQINMMKEKYPDYEIISDIASGINFNRTGLTELIDIIIKGELDELIVAHKDRLARFGYELIENLVTKYSKGKIIILDNAEDITAHEELTKDILAIMNFYVAKINGYRKYSTIKK